MRLPQKHHGICVVRADFGTPVSLRFLIGRNDELVFPAGLDSLACLQSVNLGTAGAYEPLHKAYGPQSQTPQHENPKFEPHPEA